MKGRGSNDPNTGPQRDHSSFTTNRVTGAFAYIDAGHPRKQGDRLVSYKLHNTMGRLITDFSQGTPYE